MGPSYASDAGHFALGPICFRCYLHGHLSNACPNAVVCNRCGLPGHKSASCTQTSCGRRIIGEPIKLERVTRSQKRETLYQSKLEDDFVRAAFTKTDQSLKGIQRQLDELREAIEVLNDSKEGPTRNDTTTSKLEFILSDSETQHMVGSSCIIADPRPCFDHIYFEGRSFHALEEGTLFGKTLKFMDVLRIPGLPANVLSLSLIEARGGQIITQNKKQKLVVDFAGRVVIASTYRDGYYIWDASDQFG